MKEIWENFEGWLNKNFKAGFNDLNLPATDNEITQLEAAISTSLPQDFKAFLKIHNGQMSKAGWLIDGSELLSSERIADEWGVWNGLLSGGDFEGITSEPDTGIKNDWWNPKWIPFTYDGSGNHLCLDLDPAEAGNIGQVISMWHDDGERKIIAHSFAAWFQQYIDDLQSGKYVYNEDYEAVVNVNDI